MSPPKLSRLQRFSAALYRGIVRAYPRAFREEFGSQMQQTFADCCRERLGRDGSWGLLGIWRSTLGDAFSSILLEHWKSRNSLMAAFKFKKIPAGSYVLYENPYWDGFIMGLLIALQTATGGLMMYFSFQNVAAWWLGLAFLVFLPVQIAAIVRDFKQKACVVASYWE